MERRLSVTEAAKRLGVTSKTLQRWDREGKLTPDSRSATNRRLYSESQIARFAGLVSKQEATRVVVYCRVSSVAQKRDLANQRQILEEFVAAKGFAEAEFIEEIGGGLNFKRKKFLAVMDDISNRQIRTLVLAHRDRLTRFGYEWFEHHALMHGCDILVLNQERLSSQVEMVQDLMSITHSFSARLDGLRNYKRKLQEALNADRAQD
ncbi:MAG TPA: IS607 family transposase [Paraburkholderia sp.]|jgi:predicted site-specific integrase-resolvase|uniref:IS607 family transposase n=1 Tax=Paraburkholderia sp. TaxID=1926495 RepID=UPI002DE56C8B|nr:IS607 family transposase [Paraburkholderia sp.]